MNTTLLIDGGLGRHISAIPALEKFVQNNPNATIVTNYWTAIFWGNKILTDNVWDTQTKGLFEKIKDTKIIKPEPYYNSNFLNERINMIQSFDEEINGTSENTKPNLYFSKFELNNAKGRIDPNRKTIIYQPFGSSALFQNGDVVDRSSRSLDLNASKRIFDRLKREGYQVIIFDTKGVFNENEYENLNALGYRDCAAVLAQADYFVGVDSCGMHIAYATQKPGTTFFGGTSVANYGYPDWFMTVRKNVPIKYLPMRLADFDNWLSELNNTDSMDYTQQQIDELCTQIVQNIRDRT
jgi:ADP-heptose:LPS heptosyltransferase